MNICSYPKLRTAEVLGINRRFKLLFDNVCFLLGQGGGGGGTYTVSNGLTANTATNFKLGGALTADTTITGGAFKLEDTFNSIAGTGAKISSTSTAATGDAQKLLEVSLSGANASANQNTYGVYVSNTHTGTNSFNYGGSFKASGASTQNTGVYGEASDTGVYGASTSGLGVGGFFLGSQGVQAQGSAVGVVGISTSGTGVQGVSTSGLGGSFSTNPATSNTIETAINVIRTTSGTAGDGIGVSIDMLAETTGGGGALSNRLVSRWTTIDALTRTSAFEIYGYDSATQARKLALAGSGQLTLDGYGSGSFSGVPLYSLTVDASGNILESGLGGGGGGIYGGNGALPSNVIVDTDDKSLGFIDNVGNTIFSINPATSSASLSGTDNTAVARLDLQGLAASPYFQIVVGDGAGNADTIYADGLGCTINLDARDLNNARGYLLLNGLNGVSNKFELGAYDSLNAGVGIIGDAVLGYIQLIGVQAFANNAAAAVTLPVGAVYYTNVAGDAILKMVI